MGAWGKRAFDNDTANDWAYGLGAVDDLSLVEAAFTAVERADPGNIPERLGCRGLAACEVLVRLLGNPGYTNAHTEKVDLWVAAHPYAPAPELLLRAAAVIEKILGSGSELRQLWRGTGAVEWRASVAELQGRLSVGEENGPAGKVG